MINMLMNAITKELKDRFGNKVYKNKIPQGFEEPCFFVRTVSNIETQVIDNRYKGVTVFEISYISDENKMDATETQKVISALNPLMDFITLENGDILRGYNRKTEVQDGNFHSFVQFTYFGYREKPDAQKILEMEHKGGLK